MESPALDYDIIDAVSAEYLVTRVRRKLDEGWKLVGAPMFVANTWCQAMTQGDTEASHVASSLSEINRALQELAGSIGRK
ncbi:DUF1737 domain-containing protein [Luteolibacter soli]|uniref:DUF1737 domain-containing protein n=1 Tax=Luteolibacter soli TaxID=3135280 RepID=A0ABU9AUU4_9BACT